VVKNTRGVTWITLGALALGGCSFEKRSGMPPPTAQEAVPARTASDQVQTRSAAGSGAAPAAPVPGQQAPSGLAAMAAARKLIRTGQITLTVDSYPKAADEVKRIAEAHGGYLAEASAQRGEANRQHGTLTIRVEASAFDAAVGALRALGTVRQESVSTQDVSKAYTDLETRLRVKRETADRLREILRTKTADLDDLLTAERELARITEEIEQAEGERRFYDQQIALSTLTVALQEPSAIVEAGVFTPLTEALENSLRVLAASLAGIVYATVFLAPWVLIGYVAFLVARRVWRRRKAAQAEAAKA
jgi:RNA polymerase-interacting CarD/CdnL/TRCF family regulator